MTFIYFYLLFAVTTAISGIYEIILPTLRILRKKQPDNIMVSNYWLTLFLVFLVFLASAPLVLMVALSPRRSALAIQSLVDAWKD